jgi:hypothetical protein
VCVRVVLRRWAHVHASVPAARRHARAAWLRRFAPTALVATHTSSPSLSAITRMWTGSATRRRACLLLAVARSWWRAGA